ncbi:hypothetical protein EYM_00805 [Ignicoccus islandicus DSM 13165]|uniref:Uncharacterized protein n=1 Tax=Ignicoccus islandicus DSM 13165 TaxID=940295 RepID=A0A0U3FRN1_9CREN|nr:hypothetical protein [Ignicoccus islandicus]ALU12144.1 hypothetical protein EYM_00805 [Ignicoccus islandicus DSM 13165]
MKLRAIISLIVHLTIIPFMLFHIASKIIWPLVGWKAALFLAPLIPLSFLKGEIKRAYALILGYAYLTLPLYYLTFIWGIVKYEYELEATTVLDLALLAISLVNLIIKRNPTSISMFCCIVTGTLLAFHFSFLTLWLHYSCVVALLISLFSNDLHVLLFPLNYLLKLYRVVNKVV